MKPIKASLGIIFYRNRISVSQVQRRGKFQPESKTAEFALPADKADLRDLLPQAPLFKAFLQKHGFVVNRAVVGLGAERLFSVLLTMPASKDQSLTEDMIRIQLERKTQLDVEETALGYIQKGDRIFAAAALKKQIDQIKAFLLSCGIRLLSITPVSAAIESFVPDQSGCCIVEYPESMELLFADHGQIIGLRDISNGQALSECLPRIQQEINRTSPLHRDHEDYAFVLSGASASSAGESIRRLFDRSSIKALPQAREPGDLLGLYGRMLAEKAIEGKLPPINFADGMQVHKKLLRNSRWMPRAITAACVLLLVILLFAVEWQIDRRRIADYQEQLGSIKENVAQAQAMVDQSAFARQWFNRQPLYLTILMELTSRFPETGGIWLNSLAIDESLNQVMTGKASGEQAVLDVVDNLKASPYFKEVKVLYIRQAGKNTREETFAISFRFLRETK